MKLVIATRVPLRVEYLETLGALPALIPADPVLRVAHKQIEAIADGICDAVVLIVTERARPAEKQSAAWIARQAAKVPAALRELEKMVNERAANPRLAALAARLGARASFAATIPTPQELPGEK